MSDHVIHLPTRTAINFEPACSLEIARYGFYASCATGYRPRWVTPMIPMNIVAGQRYTARFVVQDSRTQAKLWEAGRPQPTAWAIDRRDTQITEAGAIADRADGRETGPLQHSEPTPSVHAIA